MSWRSPGTLMALPVLVFLVLGFAGPLVLVFGYSVMPPKTFSLTQAPTLANFLTIVSDSYYISFLWALWLASLTVLILLVVAYPMAYGMARLFGRWSTVLTLLIVIPLLVSENIRLFGWVLVLLKNGILDGSLKALLGLEIPGILYSVPAIVLGLVYVYLPFMLFPLVLGISMIPENLKEAAQDMGANRWQIFREVEIPLAMPGIAIGSLLVFVLSLGSLAESKILGGQVIVMIADDIESAFTFAQDWPRGSALSVLLIGLSGVLVFALLRRLDLDRLLGHR